MQSGQINASQLLAAFLGSAKEKLGQKITKNDFSGELQKHLPKQPQAAGTSAQEEAGAGKTDGSDAVSKSDTGASLLAHDKVLSVSGVKTKESKAKAEKSLFVSNPAILETILANLHYPAQTRDQCQALLSKQGRISLHDLKSVLNTRPDNGEGGTAGNVPAASVRSLVGSIVQASGNAGGKGPGSANSFHPSVVMKEEGSYTREELSGLLEKVVQSVQTQSSPVSSKTPTDAQTATVESLKTGQSVQLVSTVLPSFISAGSRVSLERVLAGASASKASDLKRVDGQAAALRDSQVKADSSASSNSDGVAGSEKSGSSPVEGGKIASGMQTVMNGDVNGQSKSSAAEASPGKEEPIDAASAGLGVATELADMIKAGGFSQQKDSGASAATTGGDSLKEVQNQAAAGGQDTAMLAKHIEKFVGSKDQSSENGVLQSAGTTSEQNLINVLQMNNSDGDGFNSRDQNRQGELDQKALGAATGDTSAKSLSQGDGIATILASYLSGGEENASTSMGAPGGVDPKSKDSGKDPVQDVSNSGKPVDQAASDKGAPASGGGEATGGSSQAGAPAGKGASTASSSAWSIVQQQAVSMPAGVMDSDSLSSEEQDLDSSFGKNAPASVSATTGADKLTAAIEQSVLGMQGGAVAPKRIDETNADQDSSPGLAAVLQGPQSNTQAINNMQPADNSAQNGFTTYDPYRAVELAKSMIEQASGSGRQLVLEMDSDGLGKINLKIGAKKDEISVEALTQNEPARQALMSQSVGLRQDLRDQGLLLGKFMVDVNGGNAGKENGAQANQSGGGNGGRGASQATRARAVKTSEAPIRAVATTGGSQISVFA